MQEVEQSGRARVLLELSAPDQAQASGHIGIGWTWVQLFQDGMNLSVGRWRLPLYSGVSRPGQMASKQSGLESNTGINVCIRIDEKNGALLKQRASDLASPEEYTMPSYHTLAQPPKPEQPQPV